MDNAPPSAFSVTLCCPLPRAGFGQSDICAASELDELTRFLRQDGDILVLPEGFLHADNLDAARRMVAQAGRWVVCGTEQAAPHQDLDVVLLSPEGEVLFRHRKTALTDGDIEEGRRPGDSIEICRTPFGVVGTPLCYEIHFPEIVRVMALKGAELLLNPIGTGMWHEQQLYEWTTIAAARAIENGAFVLGCTHYCGALPMAYAFGPDGTELGLLTETHGALTVDIDPAALPARDWLRHRTPALYGPLADTREL